MHLRKKIFYFAVIGALAIFSATTAYAATTVGNDVSVGGVLTVTGNSVLTTVAASGHVTPGTDNTYNLGASSTQWRYGNFQGGVLIADGTNTSTLANTSLIIAQGATAQVGKFYVDSSGNITTSGTLAVTGLFTPSGGISTSTLDGVVIGGSTKAAGSFTTLTSTGLFTPTGGISTTTLNSVVIGGSTPAAGTFTTLTADTNTLIVNATLHKVGVVSSTPMGQLSVGAGGGVSSTISTGKFCMYAGQEDGTMVYVILGANQVTGHPFATTTVSCF